MTRTDKVNIVRAFHKISSNAGEGINSTMVSGPFFSFTTGNLQWIYMISGGWLQQFHALLYLKTKVLVILERRKIAYARGNIIPILRYFPSILLKNLK